MPSDSVGICFVVENPARLALFAYQLPASRTWTHASGCPRAFFCEGRQIGETVAGKRGRAILLHQSSRRAFCHRKRLVILV